MRDGLKQIPILKFATPFIIGLLLQYFCEGKEVRFLPFYVSILFMALSIPSVLAAKQGVQFAWSLILYSSIVVCSFHLAYSSQPAIPSQDESIYLVKLKGVSKSKRSSVLEFAVKKDLLTKKPAHFGLIGIGSIELSKAAFEVGDIYLLRCKAEKIKPPAYKHQFDFSSFYKNRGIHARSYIRLLDLQLVTKNRSKLNSLASRLSSRYIEILKSSFTNSQMAILSALLIGDRTLLSVSSRDAFANTGAIHVLAVSGLHVGLVYTLVFAFFKLISNRFFATLLALCLVWSYAVLTGLGPPVTRASLMITVYALSLYANRGHHSMNAVVLSFVVISLLNPNVLSNVSAQFSFAAVLGILLGYPLLRKRLSSKDWLMDKALSMISLSCSAQLFCFPLCLYYFGQFPLHFLLANLTVVPLMVICFHLGILWSLLLTMSHSLAAPIAKLLGIYIDTSLDLTHFLAAWEGWIWHSKTSQGELTALLLVVLVILIFKARIRWLLLVGTALALYLFIQLKPPPKTVAVLYRGKDHLILIQDGLSTLILGTAKHLADDEIQRYEIQPFARENRIRKIYRLPTSMMNRKWKLGPFVSEGNGRLISTSFSCLIGCESVSTYQVLNRRGKAKIEYVFCFSEKGYSKIDVSTLKEDLVIEM